MVLLLESGYFKIKTKTVDLYCIGIPKMTLLLLTGMCALDWYFQSNAQRLANPDVWTRHLILDQFCPTRWYEARVLEEIDDNYSGSWDDHKVGMVYA